MNHTHNIIEQLSSEARATSYRAPRHWALRALVVLLLYAIAAQFYLGLRTDIFLQLSRPLFLFEIILLGLLALSSVIAAVLATYPDVADKQSFLKLPYALTASFVILMLVQIFMPKDAAMLLATAEPEGLPCTVCIVMLATLPSALLFAIQRKGATVLPRQAGIYAVLAASALGCLVLRLHEANDDLVHMITAHYLPVIAFAALGAWVGKRLLKW